MYLSELYYDDEREWEAKLINNTVCSQLRTGAANILSERFAAISLSLCRILTRLLS